MLKKSIDKKITSSEFSASRKASDVLDTDLEPRDLMNKLTSELTKKILRSFSEKSKISN
jgi:hypothetical protein